MSQLRGLPKTFVELKDLVRIHLKQIFKLGEITFKVPINAVVLLIMVAYEVLSIARNPEENRGFLFAKEYLRRYGVPEAIGLAIFHSLRNGLAHSYEPYPILVENLGDVRLELAWKGREALHFGGVMVRVEAGHQQADSFPVGSNSIPRIVCLIAECMWFDLDDLFVRYEERLLSKPREASEFECRVQKARIDEAKKPRGEAAKEWIDFLTARRVEETE